MKRKGFIFDQIADPANLRLAFWKAQTGKSNKQYVIDFREHLDANSLKQQTDFKQAPISFPVKGKYSPHLIRLVASCRTTDKIFYF